MSTSEPVLLETLSFISELSIDPTNEPSFLSGYYEPPLLPPLPELPDFPELTEFCFFNLWGRTGATFC